MFILGKINFTRVFVRSPVMAELFPFSFFFYISWINTKCIILIYSSNSNPKSKYL